MSLILPVSTNETHEVHELAKRELICELRKTNMVLYGMFVELVREFYRFNSPYVMGAPAVRWDPDPQKTGIWIDSELNWNPSNPEFLPAVYVKLGGVQYGSPFGEGAPPIDSGMILKDAVYQRIRSGRTQVSFVHVGGNAGESCALCDNTRYFLSDFSMPIRRDFVFTKFFEMQATPIQQAQPDSKERWQSAATFYAEWNEEWGIKMESPILREITLDALHDRKKYGILSSRKVLPDQHIGEQR